MILINREESVLEYLYGNLCMELCAEAPEAPIVKSSLKELFGCCWKRYGPRDWSSRPCGCISLDVTRGQLVFVKT